MKHAPAQFLGPDRQASALIVIEMQPLASELFAQHAVFLLQIIDHILLALVQPASEGNQSEPKRIKGQSHGDIVAPQSSLLGAPNRAVYVILLSEGSNFWTLRGQSAFDFRF